jgi:pyruvate formate lyase activating enzyme
MIWTEAPRTTSLAAPSRPSEPSGLLINLQRFSLHDGPGIRTVAFLKGCPLACRWCSNPETQSPEPELLWHGARCARCGGCIRACPRSAIRESPEGPATDPGRCARCGACLEACPRAARELAGVRRTVSEVLADVLRDRPFYASSGGGLTLSGGEPASQLEFSLALLEGSARHGLNTAVETSGYCQPDRLRALADATDLLLFDLKTADEGRFSAGAGGELALVLDNLRQLDRDSQVAYIVRIPLIPGFNTDEESLRGLAGLVGSLARPQAVHLLPYHRLGASKYPQLNRRYELAGVQPQSDDELRLIHEQFAGVRVPVQGGG